MSSWGWFAPKRYSPTNSPFIQMNRDFNFLGRAIRYHSLEAGADFSRRTISSPSAERALYRVITVARASCASITEIWDCMMPIRWASSACVSLIFLRRAFKS